VLATPTFSFGVGMALGGWHSEQNMLEEKSEEIKGKGNKYH
jgi:hypothetical protein